MNNIEIKVVENKKDLRTFINLEWDIYKNDPNWVPHLKSERKKILSIEKNPFYKHAEAEYFLAFKDGVACGRIAAIKNDLEVDKKIGFFGFFECINDQNVANALFNAAKKWLKEKDLSIMRGPASPSSNDEWGMLLEGFDDAPRILMPYNPSYYLTLCENYGFNKAKDLFAYKIENEKILASEKMKRGVEIAKKRYNISISSLNMKDFKNELSKVKYVYNKAWAPNWGFVPLTDEEIDAVADDLKQIVEPSLVIFGHVGDQLVGFALVLLDYNVAFKEMNGSLLKFYKLFTKKKDIKWARIVTLGIIPEFQKKALDTVFYYEIVQRAEKLGILLGEASWILEDNDMMNRGADLMNGSIYKRYRIYDINI